MSDMMSALCTFLHLRRTDRALLAMALLRLVTYSIALRIAPFGVLKRFVSNVTHRRRASDIPTEPTLEEILWAVTAAGRRLPYLATCLAQALVAQVLLARHGYSSDLRFGVARPGGRLAAHAWLERQGRVIFGATDTGLYTVLEEKGRGSYDAVVN